MSQVLKTLLSLALVAAPVCVPAAQAQGDPELGRRLYELGLNRNGQPIRAEDRNGVVYEGEQAACLRCHRRSGFGGSEGGYYVPPITAEFLFQPSRNDRNDRFRAAFLEAQNAQHWIRARMPRSRPAYTDETLAQALRESHNPSGTRFDPLMPRYALDQADLANLTAHLRRLSKELSPGVDEQYLHLATVVGPGVDPGEREAMLATTRAFVDWYNERLLGDLRHLASTRAYGMQFRSSTRLWKLYVWELEGERDTWDEQLQRHLAERPVFAMVNGLVAGPWAPIAEFCDAQALPCLFPLTELPALNRPTGGYTIYYSRGLELEADLLAHHLATMESPPRRILQLHQAGSGETRVAARLAEHLAERLSGVHLQTLAFDEAAQLATLLDRRVRESPAPEVVVIWPGSELAALEAALAHPALAQVPVLTCSRALEAALAGRAGSLTREQAHRLTAAWPYSLPDARPSDAYRVRGWMRSRGLAVTHERIQFMSYYSLGILRDALRHMFEHFHRDYLVERVEHEADGAQNPGFYPVLALGPEQRLLSKGGYVLGFDQAGRPIPLSDWIVP